MWGLSVGGQCGGSVWWIVSSCSSLISPGTESYKPLSQPGLWRCGCFPGGACCANPSPIHLWPWRELGQRQASGETISTKPCVKCILELNTNTKLLFRSGNCFWNSVCHLRRRRICINSPHWGQRASLGHECLVPLHRPRL